MISKITLEEAINLLKKTVKFSEVKNQKHIDLSICTAYERPLCQKALVVINIAVEEGTLSQDQLKTKLGLD